MEVGIFFTAGEGAIDIARVARTAEALGFGSLWVGEHVVLPVEYERVYPASESGEPPAYAGLLSSPIVALARAAAVTSTLRLGTGVCLLPLHEPIAFAKDIATLDADSDGRFLFGVGAGWMREETEILGGDFDRRWAQIRDQVAAMKALWTREEASHHGPYVRFPAVRSHPKPVSKPHPPVLLGGASPRIFERIASWGEGWIPGIATVDQMRVGLASLEEAMLRAGRDPARLTRVAFGFPGCLRSRAEMDELGALGVEHATIWLDGRGPEVLDELERVAKETMG
ncbi:MAG: LLM class F420-dependent oxidoreductase [bacterium]|nr:LLM class F420-dependent oxidoreductase [bacterium]